MSLATPICLKCDDKTVSMCITFKYLQPMTPSAMVVTYLNSYMSLMSQGMPTLVTYLYVSYMYLVVRADVACVKVKDNQ